MQALTQGELSRRFRLPVAVVKALAGAGFIPAAAARGRTHYSREDLLILRTASALKAARISTAKITGALRNLRTALPPGSLLTLAVAASGKDLLVREGTRAWEVASRQYALPLGGTTPANAGAVHAFLPAPTRPPAHLEAEAHYARAHALEDSDIEAARSAYRDALRVHGDHVDSRINLGRLLHMSGELQEAEKVYRAAKRSSALLSFNLAILLEDLNREAEAIACYRQALALDPALHDAHFNLSRLHERAQQPREALRHLLAYRRHLSRSIDRR